MRLVHEYKNYHDYEGYTPDAEGGGGALVRITLDDDTPSTCPVVVRFNLPDGGVEDLFTLEGEMPRAVAEKLLNLTPTPRIFSSPSWGITPAT